MPSLPDAAPTTRLRTDRGAPAAVVVPAQYVRPLAGREVRGLAWVGEELLVLDARTGRLALVAPGTDDTRVVNDGRTQAFVGGAGLGLLDGALWWVTPAGLLRAPWTPGEGIAGAWVGPPELVLAMPGLEALAVAGEHLLVVRGSTLHRLDPTELRREAATSLPTSALPTSTVRCTELAGVGRKALAVTASTVWVSDDVEQTVYALDPLTWEQRFAVVTPLEGPTAIAARQEPGEAEDTVHVAYYEDEPYLADNPWIDPCWEVRYRDRALVHQLRVHHEPASRMAWSTGHRIRMHYAVDLEPDADVLAEGEALTDVTWRISLPIDSPRQRLVDVAPIGLPFEVEHEDDLEGRPQPVAVFRIPRIDAGTRLVLGWRATLEVFGIKHQVSAADLAVAPALDDGRARAYLVDDEDLDLGAAQVLAATAAAVGQERNPLLRARRIRSHVYDRLEYEMGNADSPVGVLARGTGSCGEYVGTIMALLRTDGHACRVAGRYKCPYQPWDAGPLHPDFNHVWVDLFLPGHGWVPVESNPDDVTPGGPYPDRFFMGLPWRHVELGKDISFEKVLVDAGANSDGARRRRRRIGARRLSRNHIRFDVLAELAPVGARGAGQPRG